jgi:hypothetical protein
VVWSSSSPVTPVSIRSTDGRARRINHAPPLPSVSERKVSSLFLSLPTSAHGSPPRPLGTAAGGVGMMGLRRLLLLGLLTLAAAASEGDADPLYQYAPSCF